MRPANDAGPIHVLAEDLILVDWGPMTLTVSAWDRGIARPVLAVQAGWTAVTSLKTLADFKGFLSLKVDALPNGRPMPRVVQRAFQAAQSVADDLSSMAAVAGASADETADAAIELGADKVIVNNGGDIAVRLAAHEEASVGIKVPNSERLSGRLQVNGRKGIGGVASSGWSGRSFSTGVADLVTVWAENACLADAAATFIAGKTTTSGMETEQAKAVELDYSSDLGGRLVTTSVGQLPGRMRYQALKNGARTAEKLLQRGLIRGCFISLQGDSVLLDPDRVVTLR